MEHPGKPKSRSAIDRQSRRPIERKCGLPLSGCDSHRPRAEARFGKTSRSLSLSLSLPLLPSFLPIAFRSRACGILPSQVSLPCVVRAFHEIYGTEARMLRQKGNRWWSERNGIYKHDSAMLMKGKPGPAASSAERNVTSPLCARD